MKKGENWGFTLYMIFAALGKLENSINISSNALMNRILTVLISKSLFVILVKRKIASEMAVPHSHGKYF